MSDPIAILGVGVTPFERRSDATIEELGQRAVRAAVQDSGIDHRRIGAAFVGSAYGSAGQGQRILKDLGLTGIPVTNLENACASGAEAALFAARAVASGQVDVALAVGAEAPSRSLAPGIIPLDSAEEVMSRLGMTFPGLYGMRATAHMAHHGTTVAQLAAVSVKNRRHGAANPNAAFRSPVTIDEVLRSPMIASPLTRLMSCPSADGAAAAIFARGQVGDPLAWLAGGWVGSGRLHDLASAHDTLSNRTAAAAFEVAAIGPEDVDIAEVHDAFTIGELSAIEALGIVPPGDAGAYVEHGSADIDGDGVAVNPGGGLLARGHPMGATGVAQLVEVVQQLAGRARGRQVEGARVGVCHTRGGGVFDLEANACAVLVLKR